MKLFVEYVYMVKLFVNLYEVTADDLMLDIEGNLSIISSGVFKLVRVLER